jgi:cytochrome P450
MMEATLLLATIAQRYRFTLAPEAVVAPFFSITLRPKYGLPMQVHKRQAS